MKTIRDSNAFPTSRRGVAALLAAGAIVGVGVGAAVGGGGGAEAFPRATAAGQEWAAHHRSFEDGHHRRDGRFPRPTAEPETAPTETTPTETPTETTPAVRTTTVPAPTTPAPRTPETRQRPTVSPGAPAPPRATTPTPTTSTPAPTTSAPHVTTGRPPRAPNSKPTPTPSPRPTPKPSPTPHTQKLPALPTSSPSLSSPSGGSGGSGTSGTPRSGGGSQSSSSTSGPTATAAAASPSAHSPGSSGPSRQLGVAAAQVGSARLGSDTGSAGGGASGSSGKGGSVLRGAEDGVPLVGDITRVVTNVPAWAWFLITGLALLAAGAGIAAAILARRARRTGATAAALRRRAITDPLTGVLNRRGWDDRIAAEIARAQRTGRPLAIAYLDVAGLKTVNDTYGHHAGDRLLQATARLLEENSRAEDAASRLGGDEWAVLLPEQGEEGAKVFARRIARRLPEVQKALGIESGWSLTVGWATYPHDGEDPATLLAAADRRLYARRGIKIS